VERLVTIADKGSSPERKNLLCSAIFTTNEAGHMISHCELFKIAMYLVKLNKIEQTFVRSMNEVSLQTWMDVLKAKLR
jgi:hypothetical protein